MMVLESLEALTLIFFSATSLPSTWVAWNTGEDSTNSLNLFKLAGLTFTIIVFLSLLKEGEIIGY